MTTPPGPPPAELRAWFQGVVTTNYRLLFATAYRVLENAQDTEDAVQSAVLKAFNQLDSLKDPQAVVGWLARITKHASLDMVKKGGATKVNPVGDQEAILDRAVDGDAAVRMADDDRRALRQEVARLPESLAVVITLRHLEDLDTSEVAERLGINANAARVRLFRAYERLRGNPRVRSLFGWEKGREA